MGFLTITKKKLMILGFVLLAYSLILLPLWIMSVQKQQELRGRAASPTPAVCGSGPADVMLIIDRSGSMNDQVGSSGTKLANAKTAAKAFIDILTQNTNNKVGLVTYATTATLNSPLTNNLASVKTQIDAITASGNTCTHCGVNRSNQEITANGRANMKKVTVLLTDGIANTNEGSTSTVTPAVAEQATLTSVRNGNTANGTIFFSIGLGTTINTAFLQTIASDTGGQYYASPTTDQLTAIYTQISQLLGKGSISGSVFNDVNGNGAFDTGEPKLPNWTIELYPGTSTTPQQTFTSDSLGNYSFQGLCDGTYVVRQVLQSGWLQKLPLDPQGYNIIITNNNAVTDRDFGNTLTPTPTPTFTPTPTRTPTPTATNTPTPTRTPTPTITHTPTPTITNTPTPTATPTNSPTPSFTPTPTPTLGPTSLSLTLLLDGLGSRGDNANPNTHSLSNKNPLHPAKPVDVQVLDSNNQLVMSGTGTVNYASEEGNFKGTVSLGSGLNSGNYIIKVRTEKYLRKLVAGIHTLTAGQDYTVPLTTQVAGDITLDNKLNILDYNLILDCFSDLKPPVACPTQTKKDGSDINDDSFVNQFDYNLFLRELSTQPGE